jgi:hypothetical protein
MFGKALGNTTSLKIMLAPEPNERAARIKRWSAERTPWMTLMTTGKKVA